MSAPIPSNFQNLYDSSPSCYHLPNKYDIPVCFSKRKFSKEMRFQLSYGTDVASRQPINGGAKKLVSLCRYAIQIFHIQETPWHHQSPGRHSGRRPHGSVTSAICPQNKKHDIWPSSRVMEAACFLREGRRPDFLYVR